MKHALRYVEWPLVIGQMNSRFLRTLAHWLKEEIFGIYFLKKRFTKRIFARGLNDHSKEISKQLPAMSKDLEVACRSVEPHFIQIGKELQAIYKDATGLRKQVLDSVNLIGGKKEGGLLIQLRELAQDALAELGSCQNEVIEKSAQIKMVTEHLSSLLNMCNLVEKVALQLRIVGLNIDIESSRSAESAELFSVVARDTGELSRKMKSISEDSHDALKSALAVQRSAYGNISEGLEELDHLGGNARKTVLSAVQEIEKLMASTLKVVEQASEHSRKISRHVADIVVAVQFHDSMSQRVEHIIKTLHDVERILNNEPLKEGAVDSNEKLDDAFLILELQSAQLKEIVVEIEAVYEKSVRSFDEIFKEIEALLEHLFNISTGGEKDPDQEGIVGNPFNRLRSSFGYLNEILHKGQTLMGPMRHAASQASDTVDQVSESVRDIQGIGFETHLMSLNAIINAAHLGERGGALEVLAQEVKQSSDQSGAFVEGVDELLESVMAMAEKLRDQRANDKTEEKILLSSSIEEITQAYNRFIKSSRVAHQQAEDLKNAISKTKDSLDFLPSLAERLKGYLCRLKGIVQILNPFGIKERRVSEEEAEEIVRRYSMEKERDVHEKSLYGPTFRLSKKVGGDAVFDEGAAKAKENKEINGIEDNIELFASGTSGLSHDPGGNAELSKVFQDDSKEEDGDALGDNVELF